MDATFWCPRMRRRKAGHTLGITFLARSDSLHRRMNTHACQAIDCKLSDAGSIGCPQHIWSSVGKVVVVLSLIAYLLLQYCLLLQYWLLTHILVSEPQVRFLIGGALSPNALHDPVIWKLGHH